MLKVTFPYYARSFDCWKQLLSSDHRQDRERQASQRWMQACYIPLHSGTVARAGAVRNSVPELVFQPKLAFRYLLGILAPRRSGIWFRTLSHILRGKLYTREYGRRFVADTVNKSRPTTQLQNNAKSTIGFANLLKTFCFLDKMTTGLLNKVNMRFELSKLKS